MITAIRIVNVLHDIVVYKLEGQVNHISVKNIVKSNKAWFK